MSKIVPEDFKALHLNDGFNGVLQPLYFKYLNDELSLGMEITESHLNRMSICHGGVYMTLMDFASSAAVCHHLGKFVGTPTISFSLDFMASAKLGDFIWGDIQVLKKTRSMCFTQGMVRCNDKILARCNATFKIPRDIEQAEGMTVEEFAKTFAD